MAQKKSSAARQATATTHAATKIAQETASKAARATLATVESTRSNAENVMRMSSDAVQELLANGADELQKAQEKIYAIGRESAENFSRSSDTANKTLNELLSLSRDNIEAAVEVSNIAANIAKTISTELYNYANDTYAENVEISKEIFSCRTVNDVFELQSKLLRNNMESFFQQTVKISEMLFEFAAETAEPINERLSEATERFTRSFSVAA